VIIRFDADRLRDAGCTPVALGFDKELAVTYQDLAIVLLQTLLDTARVQVSKVDRKARKEALRQFYDDLNVAFKNTLDALMPTKRTLTDLAILVAEDEIVEMAAEMGLTVERLANLQQKEFSKKFAEWKRKKRGARAKAEGEKDASRTA
jgi:predicted transcriptional regulator